MSSLPRKDLILKSPVDTHHQFNCSDVELVVPCGEKFFLRKILLKIPRLSETSKWFVMLITVEKKTFFCFFCLCSSMIDSITGEKVAVKKFVNGVNDPDYAKRTIREIKLLRLMNHENVLIRKMKLNILNVICAVTWEDNAIF